MDANDLVRKLPGIILDHLSSPLSLDLGICFLLFTPEFFVARHIIVDQLAHFSVLDPLAFITLESLSTLFKCLIYIYNMLFLLHGLHGLLGWI